MSETIRVINQDGNPDYVRVSTGSINTSSLDGYGAESGLTTYRLGSSGEVVNRISQTEFATTDGSKRYRAHS